MNEILEKLVADLRERRLWPVAAVLLVAIVAVPLVLAKSPQPVPVPPPATPVSTTFAQSLPAVAVRTGLVKGKISGLARNPFFQGHTAAASGSSGSAGGTHAGTASGGTGSVTPQQAGQATSGSTGSIFGGGSSTTSGSGGSGSGSGGSNSYPLPPSALPSGKPHIAPGTLQGDQAYQVSVAMTQTDGGLNSFTLPRDGILPNAQAPQLIELGVLQGGKRVVFAVMPSAQISGPGTCIPGTVDCELLELAPNQIETLSSTAPDGSQIQQQFAVTAISAQTLRSTAAANHARQSVNPTGRRLLSQLSSPALSLFQYEPALGAVVDLRNLTVGGGS